MGGCRKYYSLLQNCTLTINTGCKAVQCSQYDGCHQNLFSMASSQCRQTPGPLEFFSGRYSHLVNSRILASQMKRSLSRLREGSTQRFQLGVLQPASCEVAGKSLQNPGQVLRPFMQHCKLCLAAHEFC